MHEESPMATWLLKTEPDEFSWHELEARGAEGEVWDGIRNHQAAAYLRAMRKGDQAFIYHTGKEKRIVGIATVLEEAFPDVKDDTGRFVAVKVKAGKSLTVPVALATIKATPALHECVLLRQGRLSVLPISAAEWKAILTLSV
jgi:predicted RNA-binding protein with PUA-like domain